MSKGDSPCLRANSLMMPTYRSTRLFEPVSPAEPMIIGTPSSRAASSMSSRSCRCQASGLVELAEPRGTGPTASLRESAAISSGRARTPARKLSMRRGAKPRCPFGQMIFREGIFPALMKERPHGTQPWRKCRAKQRGRKIPFAINAPGPAPGSPNARVTRFVSEYHAPRLVVMRGKRDCPFDAQDKCHPGQGESQSRQTASAFEPALECWTLSRLESRFRTQADGGRSCPRAKRLRTTGRRAVGHRHPGRHPAQQLIRTMNLRQPASALSEPVSGLSPMRAADAVFLHRARPEGSPGGRRPFIEWCGYTRHSLFHF